MAREAKQDQKQETGRGLVTRSRGKIFVLSIATLVCLYITYHLARPFLPALVWAVTVAVITRPFMGWLARWVRSPSLRAAIAVGLVAIALFVPVISLGVYASLEIANAVGQWKDPKTLENWQQQLPDDPRFQAAWNWLSNNLNVGSTVQQMAGTVQRNVMAAISGLLYVGVQTLLTLFVLFYLYRDERSIVRAFKRLSPLNHEETDELFKRVADTIHATIYGTVVVAFVQGTLGGLMFWFLGLPAPLLWGLVMGLLAIIPYLGAFVVWVPAAIYLAAQGSMGKAAILTLWGMIAVGLVDNLLYPILVGDRLRQHTVVTFIAIVGGISVFGGTGIVLGPVLVTTTLLLLDIWRRRTDHGAAAEKA